MLALLLLWAIRICTAGSADLDTFTYQDSGSSSPYKAYSPSEWDSVQCANLDECVGWPDKFLGSVGWELSVNTCEWCPAGNNSCGLHHQSPINVDRIIVMNTTELASPCTDDHWMQYFDSTCTFDELVRLNAFSIERHTLKLIQPLEDIGNGTYQLGCVNDKFARAFGRIDFSNGFPKWWYLSHLEVHVPSEHNQNGKVYDGELHLFHWYSLSGSSGPDNQLGTVSIFLQAYDDAPDYDFLNRLICQWREVEEATRRQCNFPSVMQEYPGCFYYQRGFDNTTSMNGYNAGSRRNLRTEQMEAPRKKGISAHDLLVRNDQNTSSQPKIRLSQLDTEPVDLNFDWEDFIDSQYQHEENRKNNRKLMNYEHVSPWFNYFPMLGVKTEYYFRYGGTQTVPPCYGKYTSDHSRNETNNWRVMKDPIRVSQRQIDELNRLLRDRIAPSNDPLVSCQPDTAAKDLGNNKVSVARPLQEATKAHQMVFCECPNWQSKWREDRDWCMEKNLTKRLFDRPYNFVTQGF